MPNSSARTRWVRICSNSATAAWCRALYSPTSDGRWVATYEDVTERRQAEAKIMHMARHDALTNLPNRVLFQDKMEQSLGRGDALAVMFLDLDRFKSVNDSLRHSVGDALLCAVTERLQRVVPGADTVARLGGDEFAIVQSQYRPGRCQRARRPDRSMRCSSHSRCSAIRSIIGTSIGIALAPADGNEPDQLLRNADMALYRAKADGRGTYHFFQAEMDAQMQERRKLELDLRKALLADQFELYYQPLVDVASGEVSRLRGAVALEPSGARHRHAGRLHSGRRRNRTYRAARRLGAQAGLPRCGGVAVEAEGCGQSLGGAIPQSDAGAVGGIGARPIRAGAARASNWRSPKACCCRTTARCSMRCISSAISACASAWTISAPDIRRSSYLRSFPFDKIKIDRSFIREFGKENDCVVIIRAVIRLGSSLGMITTAEGVETEEQLEILRAEGCMQVQGYLFSQPIPVSEIPDLLRQLAAARARRVARAPPVSRPLPEKPDASTR